MATSSLRERNPPDLHSGKRKYKRHNRRRHRDRRSSKQDNPVVSIQRWDSMPELDIQRDEERDEGITFHAANLDCPIELRQLDVGLKDPGGTLSPVPAGSEPIKDHRSVSTALNEGQEEQLYQRYSSEETRLLGEKTSNESH